MKWRSTVDGERRTRRFYALTPYECEDGLTRWLVWLDVDETYHCAWSEPYWDTTAYREAR